MPPSRRRLLRTAAVTVAATGLAGCPVSTGYRDARGGATATTCPDAPLVPAAEPHEDGAELPPVPDPPPSLDEESVTRYAEAYELAWQWRATTSRYAAPVVAVRIDGSLPAEARGEGVFVASGWVLPNGRVAFGGDTEQPGHFDDPEHMVSYRVSREGAWRAEREVADPLDTPAPPDPLGDGRLVACFDRPRS